ncbi:MAG TPA: EscU/YscU/HrcU family type III secretion system export apparatus switch protein [Kofleriaceae bacterium]|nr:EscU/YscU/HrcU family type III secretion system export apparatus switch protein [Kofleriaceae bacterium]
MAEHRPFPPSARRRALARQAGLHAASSLVTGAIACGAALLAFIALAPAAISRLGASIAAACRGAGDPAGTADALASAAAAPRAVLALALPLLAAAAVAAAIAHLAQTRALWLPRRRIPGAPAVAHGPIQRTRRAGFEFAAAAVIGAAAFGWLWSVAPRLAALPSAPLAGAALVATAVATLAIAWAVLGVLDALLRHAALAGALRMSSHDKREDDRLAGLDPRWRAYRAKTLRTSPAEAVAGATVLVLGDDAAVAIAWDPARRPIPTRTATGRAALATQLLGLARRHRVPVHRDPALAAALATATGPVPEPHRARLAEIIAAVRRS